MEVPTALMYDEVEQLYNDEVLNTRRELQESSVNLEQLAKYCEQSFLTCQDQQAVFDQSKGYVVQSLVNVSHRLTKLSTNLSQLLHTHNGRLENINHQLFCIQQDFENIQSYQAKEKVNTLGVTISIQRQHKVVQNKSINKESKKHVRCPIDLSVLDDIGHGVYVAEEPRPVPLHQGRPRDNFSRSQSDNFSRSQIFNSSLKHNGGNQRADYYSNNGYAAPPHNTPPPQQTPPPHHTMDARHTDRNVPSLERTFDRAMTIDRSMMDRSMMDRSMMDRPMDPRQVQMLDRHQVLGGTEQRERMPDRSADQMSPSATQPGPVFNNFIEDGRDARQQRGLVERPGYERSYSQGKAPYERSMSDDYSMQQYAYNSRRDNQPPQAGYVPSQQPYSTQQQYPQHSVPPQHNLPPQTKVPPQQHNMLPQNNMPQHVTSYAAHQYQSKGYGSRGSLDDSSCTSSSPSIQSYKTRNYQQQDYDEASSQPSTNGPLSDSGLGTWAPQSETQTDKSRPISDLETYDPGYRPEAESAYIPSNYVKRVQAIFRYNKTSDDELTLPVGATIYVLQEHSDGWSEGFYNGQYGYFPANFTTLVDK